jgi:hypothetical protein
LVDKRDNPASGREVPDCQFANPKAQFDSGTITAQELSNLQAPALDEGCL